MLWYRNILRYSEPHFEERQEEKIDEYNAVRPSIFKKQKLTRPHTEVHKHFDWPDRPLMLDQTLGCVHGLAVDSMPKDVCNVNSKLRARMC